MKTLVLATVADDGISATMLSLATAMQRLETTFDVCVWGPESVCKQASILPGCDRVLRMVSDADGKAVAEDVCQSVKTCIDTYGYQRIVCLSDTFGKNVLPRLAMMFDASPVTDICDIIDQATFKRPFYAGNAIETVALNHSMHFLSIRPASFAKTTWLQQSSVEIVEIQAEHQGKSKVVSEEKNASDKPDLASATHVVSGGRGVGSKEAFDVIEKLASAMGAAVGASRAAVDAGFVPNDYQVGQTGKIIAPEVYVAIGISGAIQHLAGMKDSQLVIAINKDPDAPIFKYSDIGLVADLFDVVPKWTEIIKKSEK